MGVEESRRAYKEAESRCVALACRQHGVIARRQALHVGLPANAIDWRLKSGRWRRVFARTYAPAPYPLSFRSHAMAACLCAGEGSLVSGGTAAALHGFPGFEEGGVELTTPRRRTIGGVQVHTTAKLPPVARATVDGIPVTSVSWTLMDLGARVDPALVERALDHCIGSGRTSIPYLVRLLDRFGGHGKRGVGILRELVDERSDSNNPHSVLERRLLRLIVAAKLPPPRAQFELVVAGSRRRLDFAYPEARVAIEADSVEWHFGKQAWHADRRRGTEVAALGWVILRFTWNDVVSRPDWVISCIRVALHERSQPSLYS